jgi:hypothetical protein
LLGYAGVNVHGAMLRWKTVGSIKLYISGDITAPAHPFTWDWGQGIVRLASTSSRRSLELLGLGARI